MSSRPASKPRESVRVCFVCLGNICRSPTAESVFRDQVEAAGLGDRIGVASAGTAAYHVGDPPDARSAAAAARRGLLVQGAARHFVKADFEDFDYVLAMDAENQADLEALAPSREALSRIRLLRSFDEGEEPAGDLDVPDPYYGGDAGFERVLDICEQACRALLAEVIRDRGLRDA